MIDAKVKGEWVSNCPRTYKSWYPRRDAKFVDGEPKEISPNFSKEYLISRNIVGIYLDEDIPKGLSSRPWIGKSN